MQSLHFFNCAVQNLCYRSTIPLNDPLIILNELSCTGYSQQRWCHHQLPHPATGPVPLTLGPLDVQPPTI